MYKHSNSLQIYGFKVHKNRAKHNLEAPGAQHHGDQQSYIRCEFSVAGVFIHKLSVL